MARLLRGQLPEGLFLVKQLLTIADVHNTEDIRSQTLQHKHHGVLLEMGWIPMNSQVRV